MALQWFQGPRGFLRGPGAEPLAGVAARGRSPREILSKFGGLEAILAIRNIQIDMKLKVKKVTI